MILVVEDAVIVPTDDGHWEVRHPVADAVLAMCNTEREARWFRSYLAAARLEFDRIDRSEVP